MAETTGADDETVVEGVDTKTHPLVSKLLGDSEPPRDLGTLVGYFGPSKKPGHVRLYLELDFRDYAEIPIDQILLTRNEFPDDPEGPTQVFINGGASLELVHIASTTLSASYLQGGITQAYLGSAEIGAHPFGKGVADVTGPAQAGGFFVQTIPPTPWKAMLGDNPYPAFTIQTRTRPPCC